MAGRARSVTLTNSARNRAAMSLAAQGATLSLSLGTVGGLLVIVNDGAQALIRVGLCALVYAVTVGVAIYCSRHGWLRRAVCAILGSGVAWAGGKFVLRAASDAEPWLLFGTLLTALAGVFAGCAFGALLVLRCGDVHVCGPRRPPGEY